MNTVEGRWCGQWFEWSCPNCATMKTALQAPADCDYRCGSCKVDDQYTAAMQAMAERLETERNDWRARALSAERELRAAQRELANAKGNAA